MTRSEAIKILNKCRDRGFERTTYTIEEYHTARDMAIKALQEQNCDQCEVGNPCLYCEHEFKAQADGDLISRNNAITSVCQWGTTLERTGTYTITVAEMKQTITDMLCELPTVAIPPEHDGCKDCRWQSQSETEMPCKQCMHNYTDEWERKNPTDTITMTREEFSEKLMEHYRQGRADEKAYQNGEIMQSFNPD